MAQHSACIVFAHPALHCPLQSNLLDGNAIAVFPIIDIAAIIGRIRVIDFLIKSRLFITSF